MKKVASSVIVSCVGIVLNILLAVTKITVGLLCSMVSVVADGINNLSDCGSSVVLLVSARVSQKPADREHPYGHQRAEYIASMLIGCLILVFAVELLRESITKCWAGTLTVGNTWLYVVLGLSLVVKVGMAVMYGVQAKVMQSPAMKAAAVDSASDCFATGAVMIGALVAQFAELPADGYVGILVALCITVEGISVLRESASLLLGCAPDPTTVDDVKKIILQGQDVLGYHDLKIYRYGPKKYFATAHIEMDAALTSTHTHACIDAIERRVERETGVALTGHCDPVALDDAEERTMEQQIKAAVADVCYELNLHDFRLVRGVQKRIIFEVGVPFGLPIKDDAIEQLVRHTVAQVTDAVPVLTIERE